VSNNTQLDKYVWFNNLGASYHIKPHREWFCNINDMKQEMCSWGTNRQPKLLDKEEFD